MESTSRAGVPVHEPGLRDVIVLADGEDVDPLRVPPLPSPALVVAADGGLAWADPLHLDVDVVVGDMDSVDAAALAAAEDAGVRIDRHPRDKDRTDLAIALDTAVELGPIRVTVIGGHGGRLDHHLVNLHLLASAAYAGTEVVAYMGDAVVTVLRDGGTITGRPGEQVSLIPVHGAAEKVTTDGLRFPLEAEDLPAGSSRGVSNELLTERATVRLVAGVLVAIQPGHLARSD